MSKIQWKIELYDELPSTQNVVRDKAAAGVMPGLVVQAMSQTGGKGRQDRTWNSPKGNLYISVLLPQGSRPVPEMAFVAALAVYEAAIIFKDGLMLKWPNDVLCAGKKLAGILIENMGDKGIIVGIGVNVLSPPEGAAALDKADLQYVRTVLLDKLQHYYAQWQDEGFESIRSLWLARAHRQGASVVANGMSGTFENIDRDGALLLRDSQGTVQRISAGDVNLLVGQ